MKSVTTSKFRKALHKLPKVTQDRARSTYLLWLDNPHHPGLHFKQIHAKEPIYSIRVGLGYRATGILQVDTMIWFWIGSHEEYNTMIRNL